MNESEKTPMAQEAAGPSLFVVSETAEDDLGSGRMELSCM